MLPEPGTVVVIGDVKRGDIGSTASAYAAAHLAQPTFAEHDDTVTPDAITVNPMLGLDTLQPFIDVARAENKGLFVLLRTSNPGSAEVQDVKLADGRGITRTVRLPGDRTDIRDRSTTVAMHLLRRVLSGSPAEQGEPAAAAHDRR